MTCPCRAAGLKAAAEAVRHEADGWRKQNDDVIANAVSASALSILALADQPGPECECAKNDRVPICGMTGLTISRTIWDEAWIAYAREGHGSDSQHTRLLRQGFYAEELDHLRPGWRPANQELSAATAKIAEQQAQIEALTKDAERYRYVRNNLSADGPSISIWNSKVRAMDRLPLGHADASIDAAIEGAKHE